MRRSQIVAGMVAWLFGMAGAAHAAEDAPRVELRAVGELGFLDVLAHSLRQGSDGTIFRFPEDGGQDNLYTFVRLSAELSLNGRHTLVFLVQPLDLQTQVVLRRDVTIDELTFPEGTNLDVRYAFPFYRASYLYDLLGGPERELSVGASLQLRNATFVFTSADGSLRRTSRDVGPVPLLKVRVRWPLGPNWWVGLEADGSYAPAAIINGDSDSATTGALLDASLRGGVRITDQVDVFLNLRYLGGGARGTSDDNDDEFGDGFTSNWLSTATVSLGVQYRLPALD
ncbi:outer membrane protein [Corallococcus interemptor]|uniref:outer membrane protein n=1 Tax=Corallococcus interemptor TaxID=2316720 RepID=UPI003D052EEA